MGLTLDGTLVVFSTCYATLRLLTIIDLMELIINCAWYVTGIRYLSMYRVMSCARHKLEFGVLGLTVAHVKTFTVVGLIYKVSLKDGVGGGYSHRPLFNHPSTFQTCLGWMVEKNVLWGTLCLASA